MAKNQITRINNPEPPTKTLRLKRQRDPESYEDLVNLCCQQAASAVNRLWKELLSPAEIATRGGVLLYPENYPHLEFGDGAEFFQHVYGLGRMNVKDEDDIPADGSAAIRLVRSYDWEDGMQLGTEERELYLPRDRTAPTLKGAILDNPPQPGMPLWFCPNLEAEDEDYTELPCTLRSITTVGDITQINVDLEGGGGEHGPPESFYTEPPDTETVSQLREGNRLCEAFRIIDKPRITKLGMALSVLNLDVQLAARGAGSRVWRGSPRTMHLVDGRVIEGLLVVPYRGVYEFVRLGKKGLTEEILEAKPLVDTEKPDIPTPTSIGRKAEDTSKKDEKDKPDTDEKKKSAKEAKKKPEEKTKETPEPETEEPAEEIPDSQTPEPEEQEQHELPPESLPILVSRMELSIVDEAGVVVSEVDASGTSFEVVGRIRQAIDMHLGRLVMQGGGSASLFLQPYDKNQPPDTEQATFRGLLPFLETLVQQNVNPRFYLANPTFVTLYSNLCDFFGVPRRLLHEFAPPPEPPPTVRPDPESLEANSSGVEDPGSAAGDEAEACPGCGRPVITTGDGPICENGCPLRCPNHPQPQQEPSGDKPPAPGDERFQSKDVLEQEMETELERFGLGKEDVKDLAPGPPPPPQPRSGLDLLGQGLAGLR